MKAFISLRVAEKIQETEDSVVLTFDTSQHESLLNFKAGQYITVRATVNGEDVRRSYSLCSAPSEKRLSIGVKEIENGRMSTYLNNKITVGDSLDIMPPEGKFCVHADPEKDRDHYFIVAGSGITPVLSMIKEIIEHEPKSVCYLYYGNRRKDSIMFYDELQKLEKRYKGQLEIRHTLSKPKKVKGEGLKGVLGIKKVFWKGEKGRIDLAKMINFFELYPPKRKTQEYYLCGPAELILLGEKLLEDRNVNPKHVHKEYFTSPKSKDIDYEGMDDVQLSANINGKVVETRVKKNQTLLEALIEADANPPYSCSTGSCSSCVAIMKEGTVEMDVSYALDEDEIKAGHILTCQARATSKSVSIEYDELDALHN